MAYVSPLVLVLVTAGLVLWQFPMGLTMAAFQTELTVTERSYLFMVLLFPLLGMVGYLMASRYRMGRLTRAVVAMMLSLALGGGVCWLLGPYGLEVPTTQVSAIFFAHGNNMKVFWAIVIPLSVVTAVLTALRSLWVMSAGERIVT